MFNCLLDLDRCLIKKVHLIIVISLGGKIILGVDRSLRFICTVRDARSCELSQGEILTFQSLDNYE